MLLISECAYLLFQAGQFSVDGVRIRGGPVLGQNGFVGEIALPLQGIDLVNPLRQFHFRVPKQLFLRMEEETVIYHKFWKGLTAKVHGRRSSRRSKLSERPD